MIIGGGISGLATAQALRDLARQRGQHAPAITVLEAERRVGGKIRTLSADGFTCEWGVNGFLNKEPRTLELVQRLGLEDALLPATAAFNNRFIYTRGKLRAVKMHPLKFLLSGILPWADKWRLIRELWVPPRPAPAEGELADESVADFARRRVGPGALSVLVDPMQTGIYAGDPEQMSVLSCFPRVVEVERQYGGLIRGMKRIAAERRKAGEKPQAVPGAGPAGHLTSFRGGMQLLVDRLAEKLGDRVRLGAQAAQVTRDAGGYRVALADGAEPLAAEAVVLACPAHAGAGLLHDLSPALGKLAAQIPYAPLAVVCLGYARAQVAHPLDGFGFLVPRGEGLRMLGALWTSTIFPERAPEGQVLVRVMVGGARDRKVQAVPDEELLREVAAEVARVLGADGEPAFSRVFRHARAIPQYVLGHAAMLRQVEAQLAELPGLFISGNAYRGVGVNDCVRNAWPTAEAVLDCLSRR